jgi:hypothetical protein
MRPGAGDRQPHLDPVLERLQIVAGLERALVELDVLTAVHHLLGDERLDLGGELGRSAVAELAHALDEEGLAFREGGGKRVVEGASDRVAAHPPAVLAHAAAEAPVARRDGQIVGAAASRHGRSVLARLRTIFRWTQGSGMPEKSCRRGH